MPTACNEHFGPVAPVIPFSDDEEAIELANDTEYGLSASVFCEDAERARNLADRVEAGMIHINDQPINEDHNAPFGGVKQSGLGRYHGEWITRELTEPSGSPSRTRNAITSSSNNSCSNCDFFIDRVPRVGACTRRSRWPRVSEA